MTKKNHKGRKPQHIAALQSALRDGKTRLRQKKPLVAQHHSTVLSREKLGQLRFLRTANEETILHPLGSIRKSVSTKGSTPTRAAEREICLGPASIISQDDSSKPSKADTMNSFWFGFWPHGTSRVNHLFARSALLFLSLDGEIASVPLRRLIPRHRCGLSRTVARSFLR